MVCRRGDDQIIDEDDPNIPHVDSTIGTSSRDSKAAVFVVVLTLLKKQAFLIGSKVCELCNKIEEL